jgi:competence protein ComEA
MSKVSINAADAATLDGVAALRGHGYEIVRYREERGRFTELRQLDEVPGMAGVLDDALRAQLLVD